MTTAPNPAFHRLLRDAQALQRCGQLDRAVALLEAALTGGPGMPAPSRPMEMEVLFSLGAMEEARGRADAAIARYEAAAAISPGHGTVFTRLSLLRMRQSWSTRPPPRRSPGDASAGSSTDRVSMTQLGRMGRFCDQLSQYVLLRCHARRHGLAHEVPDWVGRHLFDLDDPAPAGDLPPVSPEPGAAAAWLAAFTGSPAPAPSVVNCDLPATLCWAAFESDAYWRALAREKDFVQGLFRPVPAVAAYAGAAMAALRERGRTIVAVHLRRGDFRVAMPDRMTSESTVLDWLDALWPTLPAPVLYLASDEAEAVAPSFARFAPVLARDLASPLPGAEYFLDWHVLTQADVLAVSLSRFSWVAAQLNVRARAFHAPAPDGTLRPFNPWEGRLL